MISESMTRLLASVISDNNEESSVTYFPCIWTGRFCELLRRRASPQAARDNWSRIAAGVGRPGTCSMIEAAVLAIGCGGLPKGVVRRAKPNRGASQAGRVRFPSHSGWLLPAAMRPRGGESRRARLRERAASSMPAARRRVPSPGEAARGGGVQACLRVASRVSCLATFTFAAPGKAF